jgi:hypothetical protein
MGVLFRTTEGTSVNQESFKDIRREESSLIERRGTSSAAREGTPHRTRSRTATGRGNPWIFIALSVSA